MAKYHIKLNGEPGVCKAEQGNCPRGGENDHYESPEEARVAYEKTQGSSFQYTEAMTTEKEYIMDSIPAESLTTADEFNGSKVLSVKVGRKNVTVDTEAKKNQIIPIGEKVPVFREQATALAKEAKRALNSQEYREVAVRRSIEESKENLTKALTDFNETFEKGYAPDSFRYTALMNAQAERAIWQRVENIAEKNNISHTEAAAQLKTYFQENWSDYQLKNAGLSRSTSVLSNALDAAQDEAIIRFVRNSRWYW